MAGPETADPQRVGTPQPTRQATSNEWSSGIFTQLIDGTTVYCEKVEIMAIWPMSVPSLCIRKVASSWQPASSMAPESHRFCLPLAHHRHRPQPGLNCRTTWAPG